MYVNLNLNVSRRFRPGDGVRDAERLGYGKSCTYFNPQLIELQHEFARQLLTHSNPYTGSEYRHEPAVATIEIVNENSVLEGWVKGRLVGADVEKGDTWSPIPISYAEELTDLYNRWLVQNLSPSALAALRAEAGVGEDGQVPRLAPAEFRQASAARFRTEAEFYMDVERRFFSGMRRLLKDELGVQPPIIGTADHNDGYAAYAHIEANAMFDWIDGHGYWQHPNTRTTPPTCQNTPMVNDPLDSTVTQFARTPVLGRAFTISEVNHPFPHETACEGYPILTVYALFHDWDGIYWFTWDNGRSSSDGGIPQRAFFTIPPDPVKVANLIACSALWHQGGITPAATTIVRTYTRDQMIEALRMDRRESPFFTPGFDRTLPLMHATRFRFDGGPGTPFPTGAPLGDIVTDTREIAWRGADRQRGLVTVDAAGAQALIGFVRGSGASTTHLAAEPENAFCSLLLVPLDGRPVRASQRLLLAATSWCGNSGMQWDERRKALIEWGTGPVLIEPVTGPVTLRRLTAGAVRATALTSAGARTSALLPVAATPEGARISLGQPAATLVLIEIGTP